MEQVLVLGGGFAGVESAIQLRKRGFDVTLISERDYAYVYPISIWIPTGALAPEGARLSLPALARKHGFELVVDRVSRIDSAARQVMAEGGTYPYDSLVLALGSGKSKPEGVEHTFSTCGSPQHTLALRDGLQALLKDAEAARDAGSDRRFTIAFGFAGDHRDRSTVRGGPVFEMLFNVRRLLKKRRLLERVSLAFFAPMPKPGIKMGERVYAKMIRWFDRLGVRRAFGKPIERFDARGVQLAGGDRVDADLVVFVPPNAGHPVVQGAGFPLNEAGFVRVDPHGQVLGHPRVYAAGDVAALEGPDWLAKQGHLAEVMAKVAANNLVHDHTGQGGRHTYAEHISILCVMDTGDGAAIVYRSHKRQLFIPLPIIGHWMKRAWGVYWKWSKLGRFPRLPGM